MIQYARSSYYYDNVNIFADDREGNIACDISRDLMKVQQVQVSFDVIYDSSVYVIIPERNGRLNRVS